MPRIVAGVEYLGTHFHGFQTQLCVRTVQAELERALSEVAAQPIRVICAGRTDAGVHALEQVIHFDTEQIRTDSAWVLGTNRFLPNDVNILWAREVDSEFHARFHATARRYHYKIYHSRIRSALRRDTHLWQSRALDVPSMQKATQALLGTHDFSSFRDSQCQAKSPIKTIEHLTLTQEGKEIILDIKANAFLHHMVRNIVGTLLKIGYGDKPVSWMKVVLEAKDRTKAGMTAPSEGLYFVKAFYNSFPDVNMIEI